MNKMSGVLKWVLLLGYFPVMLAFVSVSHQSVICSDVNVIVSDSAQARFVIAEDIRKSILKAYPDLLGAPVSQVNFDEMEAAVNEHSAIRSTQVFNSGSGVLNVMVTQHEPIVRVFAAEGTFYLDEAGRQIPVSSHFSAHVLVVNGTIPKDRSALVKVAGMIAGDPFWAAQMEQIYIRRNNEYILVPRVGDHLILFGQPIDVEKKLRNLKVLYTSGLDPKEWNEYQVINLKFENQIICSRNRSL
jgi:cell division protein FtsQ